MASDPCREARVECVDPQRHGAEDLQPGRQAGRQAGQRCPCEGGVGEGREGERSGQRSRETRYEEGARKG